MAHQIIAARQALTAQGWRENVVVAVDEAGRIAAIEDAYGKHADVSVGALLPAIGNVHSHAFQRAMAGLAETRGRNPVDNFWTWREVMYRFLAQLTPEDVEAIGAQVQMEMLEAGFGSVGEFHYLHHQPDGASYAALGELSERMFAAAEETGIGYTHLPVLYMRGGLKDEPLSGAQLRFGCDIDQFERLIEDLKLRLKNRPADFHLGVAPHSLRAVDNDALKRAAALAPDAPVHIHIAEQTSEVEDVKDALGARPVEWLLKHHDVNERWCLVHATHMTQREIQSAAASNCVIGACPITEANLGDGVIEAEDLLNVGGRIAVGSDSNVRISLAEELRMLEYSQRLRDKRRAVLASATQSCGRYLYEHCAKGGAQALGRDAGRIETGAIADLVALDLDCMTLAGLSGDTLIDAWVFAGDDSVVTDVWSAGRRMVKDGRHIKRKEIETRFTAVAKKLRATL